MKILSLALVAAIVPLALLTACGNSVVGGGGQTSTGGGGNATTTTTATGLGGGACDPWTDFPGLSTVTVSFKNNTGMPIYLPMSCTDVVYTITPASGSTTSYVYDPSCLQTCQDLQTQPQYDCGACLEQTRRIDAGATHTLTWNGTGLGPYVDMDAACWQGGVAYGKCTDKVQAPAGSYTFGATAYSACGDSGGACTCTEEGACAGSPTGTQATGTPASINFPAANAVEVVFDTCAFGCPGGG
jgi:hypothetical protein